MPVTIRLQKIKIKKITFADVMELMSSSVKLFGTSVRPSIAQISAELAFGSIVPSFLFFNRPFLEPFLRLFERECSDTTNQGRSIINSKEHKNDNTMFGPVYRD